MEEPASNTLSICPNCRAAIDPQDAYCAHCGQKNTDGRTPLRQILAEILENTFNLNYKIFPTLRDLCFPGRLTNRYFQGVRGKYFSPARLFFVSALLLFAVFALLIDKADIQGEDNILANGGNKALLQARKDYQEAKEKVKPMALVPADTALLDSLEALAPSLSGTALSDTFSFNISFINDNQKLHIPYEDIILHSPDSVLTKYGVTKFWERLFAKQVIKSATDARSALSFIVGKTFWGMIVLMPFLALLLKLMYLRRSRYYIEHLVFCFHTHSFSFIVLALILLLRDHLPVSVRVGALVVIALYIFLAFKLVYRQSYVKTLFKLLFILMVYLVMAIVFTIITLIIGFLLF